MVAPNIPRVGPFERLLGTIRDTGIGDIRRSGDYALIPVGDPREGLLVAVHAGDTLRDLAGHLSWLHEYGEAPR